MPTPALARRTLNRTLLRRQHLLERTRDPLAAVVAHLVGVQAQEPNWPYVGLWSRVRGFAHDLLTRRLEDGSVVRGASLRTTQHLSTAADFGWLRATVQPAATRQARTGFGKDLPGVDLDELAAVAARLLGDGTARTRSELGVALAVRFPGPPNSLAWTAHFLVGMVHPVPSCVWGTWRNRGATPVALPSPTAHGSAADPARMVRRYLAAFGPAGVKDVQVWSGLTGLRAVLGELRAELRSYRDEQGVELFDLPDAELADPDADAPVRFLPAYDNLVLSHADRTRIVSDGDRRRVAPGLSAVLPTFLVDGLVAGTWAWDWQQGVLTVSPFRPLAAADRTGVEGEAELLLAVLAPGGAGAEVRLG